MKFVSKFVNALRSRRCFLATPALAVAALSASAQTLPPDPIPPPKTPNKIITGLATTSGVLRVKGTADECYLALGQNIKFDFINQSNPLQPCAVGKLPKVDQGYIWGASAVGTKIYFGTTANGQCVTQGGITKDPSRLKPYQTDSWACEFGVSPYVPSPFPAQIGDLRPPRMYVYDTVAHTIRDITPKAPYNPANPLGVEPFVLQLRGVRTVYPYTDPATNKTYIVIGGPALAADGRLNFLVYDTTTGRWVAKYQLLGYDNTRRWVQVNGITYAAVGKSANQGGAVLRIGYNFAAFPPAPSPQTGSVIPICASCFSFQNVGDLDGEGAYIAVHQNRLFVTTWPQPGLSGLYMSPTIPADGLTAANAYAWRKIWQADNYEPDPVIAKSYAGGALASYGGYLYFGTMNVPWSGTGVWAETYGVPADPAAQQQALVNSFRTIIILRASNFTDSGTPTFELLYGNETLPVYQPGTDTTPGVWVSTPNNMGQKGKYGTAGFGNPYNNYTWSMGVWNNKLWVGTMDWSYMASKGSAMLGLNAPPMTDVIAPQSFGGDLFYFAGTSSSAVAETNSGVGNYTSYGIRNILPLGASMFVAGSNPMNLLTNPADTIPDGGWELIELRPKAVTIAR